MKALRISELARLHGLSRSTLLYYHRIGLLLPSGRTPAGYRVYTSRDRQRLAHICQYRAAGLPLSEIANILAGSRRPRVQALKKRLRATSDEIVGLRNQQRILAGMLSRLTGKGRPPTVDKDLWVDMLQAAGVSQESMDRWHREFERRTPQGHQEFLVSLGLSEPEIRHIRSRSASKPPR